MTDNSRMLAGDGLLLVPGCRGITSTATDSPVWHHRKQQSSSEQERSREQQGDEQAKQSNGETASPAKTNGNGQPQSQGSVVAQLSDIVQTRSLLYRSNKVDWQVCTVQRLCCTAQAV